jgi:prevent-host-death family protein
MEKIGAYEAKTTLPSLLERVERGERFVITRHGKPVAELGPVTTRDVRAIRTAIAEIDRFREQLATRGVTLRNAVGDPENLRSVLHEGHRY